MIAAYAALPDLQLVGRIRRSRNALNVLSDSRALRMHSMRAPPLAVTIFPIGMAQVCEYELLTIAANSMRRGRNPQAFHEY